MPSFDIVSKTDVHELDNAIAGVMREIGQRFDFKGSKAQVAREKDTVTITADDETKLRQVQDLVRGHVARRKLDPACLDFSAKPEKAAGGTLRQEVAVRQGIDPDTAKRIVKDVKDSKLKVQVAIQGDMLRVSAKKIDDLQAVIARGKEMKIDRPLQYVNMRS